MKFVPIALEILSKRLLCNLARLVLSTPGGAGYCAPRQWQAWRVQEDVAEGAVSVAQAPVHGWQAAPVVGQMA